MPIYKEIKNKKETVLIWKYDENDDLEASVYLDKETIEKIRDYHPKKRKEVLMIRKMLAEILPKHHLSYYENGEPYLLPKNKNISISHSFPFAVLAIAEDSIGVDLERVQPKIQQLKSRFLYKTEYSWVENQRELEYLTVVWAMKESLYKIHPSKYWSFREHYEIEPFDLSEVQNKVSCRVFDGDINDFYHAEFQKIEDYYLVIVRVKK